MSVVRVAHLLREGQVGETVSVEGWLRTARHSKGLSFLDVSDGSSMQGLQVVAPPELPNYEDDVARLTTGCAVRATGTLVESPGKGQRVELRRATSVEVVGGVADDYPLQKKRHSFEFLRTIAHLRPRTNTLGAVLARAQRGRRARSTTSFRSAASCWLHAPIITAPRTPRGRARCSACRRSTRRARRGRSRATSTTRRTSSAARPSSRCRASSRRRSPRSRISRRLHLRSDLPRRELEHEPPPRRVLDGRARDGLLRPRRQRRASRSPSCASMLPPRPRRLPRRHGLLQPAHRQDRASSTLAHIVDSPLRAHHLHRGRSRSWSGAARDFEFPVEVGRRPAERARALS